MHTPTLVSTAFTAAVLFAGHTQAAPIRRGSVVDDEIAPRSGTPSRRGSTTEELSNSRRGSIADDIMASRRRSIISDAGDLARRGSAPSPMDIANARRRSSVIDTSSPSRRSSLAAGPQDIANARRRSVADGALPVPVTPEESRRSSVANDIFAARKRSLIAENGQPMRRSSLANPADIFAARKRSMTPGGPLPSVERRSVSGPAQGNPASLSNRKAFVAEPEEILEARDFQATKVSPSSLPNRKAFIAPVASELQERDEVAPKVLPVHLPNRKAFIAPTTEDLLQKRDDDVAPNVQPSRLPNRKAFIAPDEDEQPEIKISMTDIPSFSTYSFPATPAAEKRDFDPFFVPNRKAFIHPDQAALDSAGAKIGVKPYTFPPAPINARRSFDPASLPNRKAFIYPDELKINELSVEANENDSQISEPAAPPAAALRRARRNLDPASLPNRKAFIASPAGAAGANFEAAPAQEAEAVQEAEQSEGMTSEEPATQAQSDGGTAIPLLKRAGAPLNIDGVVDIEKAQVSSLHF